MARDARLNIEVDADTAAARRELNRFSRQAGAWAGVTSAAVSGVWNAAIAGAGAAVDFLGNAVDSAAELSGQIATTTQRFGEASQGLQEWARTADTELGLSSRAALEAANQFSVFGDVMGLSGQDLADYSTDLTTLAVDLAALNNVTPEQAINNLSSAFRGSTEVLDNLGIIANEAALKQAYLAETGEEVTGTMTGQQRALALTALLYEQGADATGQFARESDELINQQAVASAQWENLTATLGEALIPVVSEVVRIFSEEVVPWLRELWAELGPVVERIMAEVVPALEELWKWFTANVLPAIQELWSWLAANLIPVIQDLWRVIATDLIPRIQELWSAIQELWQEIDAYVMPVLEVLVTIVGAILVGAFRGFGLVLGIVTDSLRASAAVARALGDAFQWVSDKISTVIGWVQSLIDWLGRIDLGIVGDIAGAIGGILPFSAGGGPSGTQTTTITYNLNVSAPVGASSGDVATAIVAHLRQWEARNGRRYYEGGR